VITIYILIPFILIPQLLFSGVIVKFDRLHRNNLSSYEYVPVIGDLMAARWSFEALAVEQFKNNKYERNLFKYEQGISQNNYYSGFLINEALNHDLNECLKLSDNQQFKGKIENNFYKLNYYISELSEIAGFGQEYSGWKESMNSENFNGETKKVAERYLDSLSKHFNQIRKKYYYLKDSVNKAIEAKIGNGEYVKLQTSYQNKQLETLVLDRLGIAKYIETDKKIIQKFEPGYMVPTSKNGRTHFYAPFKQVGALKIDTYWFNLVVLWVVTLGLYIALYYNLFQKAMDVLGNFKIRESGK